MSDNLFKIYFPAYLDKENQNKFPSIQYIQGYIYIENVFVPANFTIQYKRNLFFPNIDGAILNANIQPPLYNSPIESKDFENFLEMLYYNPIIVATEKIISEEINQYTDKEMIKFIGIVDSASIKISYSNASSIVNFLAVDLLNYALKVSNLYLFGNNLNLGAYNNASISLPSVFIQSIFLKALQSEKISIAFKNLIYPILMYKIMPVKIDEVNESKIKENEKQIEKNEKQIKEFENIFSFAVMEGDKLDKRQMIEEARKKAERLNRCHELFYEELAKGKMNRRLVLSHLYCLEFKANNIINFNQITCEEISNELQIAKKEFEEFESKYDYTKNVIKEQIEKILTNLLFEKYNGENGFYVLSDFGKKLLYNPSQAEKELEEIIKDTFTFELLKAKANYFKKSRKDNAYFKMYLKNYDSISKVIKSDANLYDLTYKLNVNIFNKKDNETKDMIDLLSKIMTIETGDNFSRYGYNLQNLYNSSGVYGLSQKHLITMNDDEIDYAGKLYGQDVKKEFSEFKKMCSGIIFYCSQENVKNYSNFEKSAEKINEMRIQCAKNKNSNIPEDKIRKCIEMEMNIVKKMYDKDKKNPEVAKKFALYTALKTLEGKYDILLKANKFNNDCTSAIKFLNSTYISNENNTFDNEYFAKSDENTKKRFLMLFYNGCSMQAIANNYPGFNDDIEYLKFKNAKHTSFKEDNIHKKINEELAMLSNIDFNQVREIIKEKIKLFFRKAQDEQNNIDYFKDDEIENLNSEIYNNFLEIPFSKMLNLRRFILSSILMPKYFSNWSLLSNAIITNLANLNFGNDNLHNLGQLISRFLSMLNLRLTIFTNPILITKHEDKNLQNRIFIYALIPDLQIPPIPNNDNFILNIILSNNRITQENIATTIDISIISPSTTMAVFMPIMGSPTLVVFPLEKIKKYAKENAFITATNFVGKWSKLEFIRIPTINFVQSPEENFILNAVKTHQIMPENDNFSLAQMIFLAYMRYCFHFWKQFAYREISLSNIPAIYPFFISFPFLALIPGGGSYIGILDTLLKSYSAGGSSYSFNLANTYNVEAFKNVIKVIDSEFDNNGIFRDFRFGVNDYYYLKAIIDLISFNSTNTIYLSLEYLMQNAKNIKNWYNIRNAIYFKLLEIYTNSIEIGITYFKQSKEDVIKQPFSILNYNLIDRIYNIYMQIIEQYEKGKIDVDIQNIEGELKNVLRQLISNGKITFYTYKEDVQRKYQ